jgi:transcriptional regulator with XRE-family HTH domain
MGLGEPTSERATESADAVPSAAAEFLGRWLAQSAEHWDRMVGSLRALAPPIGSRRLADGAVLRVVVVDLSVRAAAMLYLLDAPAEASRLPRVWYERTRISEWLNALRHGAGLTRDQLAKRAQVEPSTLDGWLSEREVRPNGDNLLDLANALGEANDKRSELYRALRIAYGMRAIFERVEGIVGADAAAALVARLREYPPALLAAVRANGQPAELNVIAMRLTLLRGATRDVTGILPWVGLLLEALARAERDPVWRTTLRALPRGWHDHLLDVATRLGPSSEEVLRQLCGAVPPHQVLERAAYLSQASPEELGREPLLGAALQAQLRHGGAPAAIEWNRQAIERYNRLEVAGGIALWHRAIEADPSNAEMHFRLGCALWRCDDVKAGLAELEIAARLDPGWDQAHVEISIVLGNVRRDTEALEGLERCATELRERTPWFLLHLAYRQERVGQLDTAIATYRELLATDPHQAEAMDRLAHLLFVRRRKREGAELAKRAAQSGIHTVLSAWNDGYYRQRRHELRPPHTVPEERLIFSDLPWFGHVPNVRGEG